MTISQIGEGFRTPSVSEASRSSFRSGSFKLTPAAYSVLRGVLEDHKFASEEDRIRAMSRSLREIDPSFTGSLSRSVRSGRSRSVASSRSGRERVGNSAVASSHISLTRGSDKLEVVPVAHCSKDSQESKAQEQAAQYEVTREWAKMVETGGVSVKTGVSCFYKDDKGIQHFVSPPTCS